MSADGTVNHEEKQLICEHACSSEVPWSVEESSKTNVPILFLNVLVYVGISVPTPRWNLIISIKPRQTIHLIWLPQINSNHWHNPNNRYAKQNTEQVFDSLTKSLYLAPTIFLAIMKKVSFQFVDKIKYRDNNNESTGRPCDCTQSQNKEA